MAAETVEEVEIPEDLEIQWEEVKPPPEEIPERLAIMPPVVDLPRTGRHAASESITDDKPPPRESRQTRVIPPPKSPKSDRIPPPKIRAPDFSEWHDYLGNFAIKWVTRGYIAFVFRGVDRYELLSPQDNEALELDDEQLSDIAKPIAHLADRSKLGKKYGRVIIDSSDGIVAMIQLGMWGSRVNRIAKKYRGEGHHRHDHGIDTGSEGGSGVQETEPEYGTPSQGVIQPYNTNHGPAGFGYN
jgi:hypothetical protein